MSAYSLALLLTLAAVAASGALFWAISRWRPIHTPEPVSDASIARTAMRVLKRHRANAARFAAERAAKFASEGDAAAAETWSRIQKAIEAIVAARGEKKRRAGAAPLDGPAPLPPSPPPAAEAAPAP